MNNFEYSIAKAFKSEGGYSNDPQDPGGETYRGISRRSHPNWSGWRYLDSIPNKKYNQTFTQVESEAKTFYLNAYWLKNALDMILDKDVAYATLDTVIQHGKGASLIQQALQKMGKPISVDNKIGNETIAYLNATPSKDFLSSLHDVREAYYRNLVAMTPSLAKYLPGWLKRISPWKGAIVSGGIVGLIAMILGGFFFLKSKKVS